MRQVEVSRPVPGATGFWANPAPTVAELGIVSPMGRRIPSGLRLTLDDDGNRTRISPLRGRSAIKLRHRGFDGIRTRITHLDKVVHWPLCYETMLTAGFRHPDLHPAWP